MKISKKINKSEWDIIVSPQSSIFHLNLKEVWAYRDLIILLVKRDLTTLYKQTILGPLWMFIQPIFTTLIYTFTFGQAKLSTDGIPPILFYLIGQTFWGYFSECLTKTSTTFISNASVFGKVYFPRLVVPVSIVISNLIKLGIQLSLLLIIYLYYSTTAHALSPQWKLFILLPLFIAMIGVFSLSLGILFSSVTTKYRDFNFLITFAIQLVMFISCVVLPASMFNGKTQFLMLCNPVAGCMEAIKHILTGSGVFSSTFILINTIVTLFLLAVSVILFNRTEKSFMDTV